MEYSTDLRINAQGVRDDEDVGPKGPNERRIVGPAPHLGEENEVQGRCVDGPVVARKPRLRSLSVPDLVDDLARLGVDRRVLLGRS